MNKEETGTTENREETLLKAMDAATAYLEYKLRTCREMRTKLRDKGYEEAIVEEVIDRLTDLHYLDDTYYAGEYLRYALDKYRGSRRIAMELAKKGIDKDVLQQAIYDYEDQEQVSLPEVEYERALQLGRKTAQGKEPDQKLNARIGRKLAQAGYANDIVYRVLGELRRPEEVDLDAFL